ncbi:MAG: hypothetical protein A2X12_10415 [Bacteroidetes bacterium GWE2_29_8]|nr:MAG: hypothetical protein A2X12_10415 [Bacteroidetes bacterium GWE2_29_8]OFY16624.1 MAG: hypothetical protein A2X02_05655 [Bacteroidetes bacterium GWF2_29_10]
MKVLTVIPGSSEGSSMIFAKRQVLSLIKEGVESRVFFLSSRTSLTILYKESLRFRKQIKEFNPDIIHCHYGTMTSFFCVVNTNKKLVITFHGSDINKTPFDGFFKDLFGRILSQLSILKAKGIFCVSESLSKKVWWRNEIVRVVPIGINIDMFIPIDRNEARKRLGWSNDKKIVLFNSNNPIVKRLDIAKNVIEILQKNNPDYMLYLLEGEISPDTIPLYINASDCLLICSDNEGSPMMVKEAMACNLPIVGVDVGDVKERILEVSNCIVSTQNAIDLSIAIEKVIQKNERTNGRDVLIKQELTENIIANKIITIFENIYKG